MKWAAWAGHQHSGARYGHFGGYCPPSSPAGACPPRPVPAARRQGHCLGRRLSRTGRCFGRRCTGARRCLLRGKGEVGASGASSGSWAFSPFLSHMLPGSHTHIHNSDCQTSLLSLNLLSSYQRSLLFLSFVLSFLTVFSSISLFLLPLSLSFSPPLFVPLSLSPSLLHPSLPYFSPSLFPLALTLIVYPPFHAAVV